MLLVVSVVIDTERPDALAVYLNGRLVWPSRDWLRAAPCRGLDPDVFVPEEPAEAPDVVAQLCPSCPVRDDCEGYGRDSHSVGWWGGVLLGMPTQSKRLPKLSWDTITEIRRLHDEEGIGSRVLGRRYAVSRTYMRRVLDGTKRTTEPRAGATRVHTSKLKSEDVAEMRRRHAAGGVTYAALAREYGIDESYTRKVIRGEEWADGQTQPDDAWRQERACDWCGASFQPVSMTNRYCCRQHMKKAQRAK